MAIIITKQGAGAQRVEESGVPQERFLEDDVAANPESLPMERDIGHNVVASR